MNINLTDIVRYQHQKFVGLTDPTGLEAVRLAFIKLKPVEYKISQHPDADIDFLANGKVVMTGMPDDLLKIVSDLLRA